MHLPAHDVAALCSRELGSLPAETAIAATPSPDDDLSALAADLAEDLLAAFYLPGMTLEQLLVALDDPELIATYRAAVADGRLDGAGAPISSHEAREALAAFAQAQQEGPQKRGNAFDLLLSSKGAAKPSPPVKEQAGHEHIDDETRPERPQGDEP